MSSKKTTLVSTLHAVKTYYWHKYIKLKEKLTKLCPNKNNWDTRCIVFQLWNPLEIKPNKKTLSSSWISIFEFQMKNYNPFCNQNLFRNIFVTSFADEGKCQYENISSTVTQRSQPVIILLPCSFNNMLRANRKWQYNYNKVFIWKRKRKQWYNYQQYPTTRD